MKKTQQSTEPSQETLKKNSSTSGLIHNKDENETEEEDNLEDTDEFDDEDEYKPSFRIKAIRTMRLIKKHSKLLITAIAGCTIFYMYWHKLWLFGSKTNSTTQVQQNTENAIELPTEEHNIQNQLQQITPDNKREQEAKNTRKKEFIKIDNEIPSKETSNNSKPIQKINPTGSATSLPAEKTTAEPKYHINKLVLPENSDQALKKLEEETALFTEKYANLAL
ncbi:hypothetical protein EKK58_03765 [Candidatus Dependentiae bacterium]|nr:MAG: hypothetical protein EKK58_03765 [Candidatus Dependentiae bacterium]